MAFTAKHREFYDANGYVIVEDLVPPDVVRTLRDHVAELCEAAEAGRAIAGVASVEPELKTAKPPLRKLHELCLEGDELMRGVAKSAYLLDIAAELAGHAKSILLYSDQVFLKPAFCGSEKPLHQDNSYFRVMPQNFGVTCWMALDDATIENGCMHYIPGSHKLGLLPHKSITYTHLTPDTDKPLAKEVPAPVRAGGCIFHHLLCLHSSKANTSPKPRRAWALHYVNAAAECPSKPREKMVEMR
jgi:phytanoyl-CoA hydroxylase